MLHDAAPTKIECHFRLTSSSRRSKSSYRARRSSRRPGVATTMESPGASPTRFKSTATASPPVIRRGGGKRPSDEAAKWLQTAKVCLASSRVGEMMRAPTQRFFKARSRRRIISTAGTTKARVFPLPVHASALTSRCPSSKGIEAAYEKKVDARRR